MCVGLVVGCWGHGGLDTLGAEGVDICEAVFIVRL